jgi:Txe/YoeB family toxin of Txe-Axe toxin-antitoxin module
MAKSQAKKARLKLQREGRLNPEFKRGSWNGISPLEKRTPSLQEEWSRKVNKHKKRWEASGDDIPPYLCLHVIAN